MILELKANVDNLKNSSEIRTFSFPSIDACKEWKKQMYKKAEELTIKDKQYVSVPDVLKYIYKYMNKVYSVVWEQEIKDYMQLYETSVRPQTLDVIYHNSMYKSIFEAVLCDLIENTEETDAAMATVDETIKPLIEKYGDTSNAGCATFKRVYSHMEKVYKVDWKNHITRYMHQYGTNIKPKKIVLITAKPQLRKKFIKSIEDMLKEENGN